MAQTPIIHDGGYWYAVRARDITVDVFENVVADDDAGIYDPGTYLETIVIGVEPDVPAGVSYSAFGPVTVAQGPPAARGVWFLIRTVDPVDLPEGYAADDYMAHVGWLPDDLPFARLKGR